MEIITHMPLTSKQRQHLRGLAHHLKPVIMVGNKGLTESVLDEIDLVLERHELIKVKIAAGERDDRQAIIEEICLQRQCQPVQSIGRVAVVYRAAKEPTINLKKIK